MSEPITVQRLSSAVNAVVVQLPERKQPGVVIQGDSLGNLKALASEVRRLLAPQDYQEADGVASEVESLIDGYFACFEAASEQRSRAD